MAICLIGLGSNLGDRAAHLQSALQQLATVPQIRIVAASSLRDTKPAGGPSQQSTYLNAAATLETSLSPPHLLAELQRIETELGRIRSERWGPRTIDLDLLLYDQLELESPELTLPHPRISFRRFVLEPAAEIAGEMVHPINSWTIAKLLTHLRSTPREINLAPAHTKDWCHFAPATRLLKELALEKQVQPLFWPDINSGTTRKNLQPNSRWIVSDLFMGQLAAQRWASDPAFEDHLTLELSSLHLPRLVVVWQPEDAPILDLLDKIRRNRECPPVLWIPRVTLEQARQEVIAAMSAME